MDGEDISILQYAGAFSATLRKQLPTQDAVSLDEDLDISVDLEDELESTNALEIEAPKTSGKTKGQLKKELMKEWDPSLNESLQYNTKENGGQYSFEGYMDPKKFYKGNKSGKLEPLPKRYQVGVMTSSSGVRAGPGEESQASGAVNSRKRRKGVSILSETLGSDLSWTRKKYREIQQEKTSGSKGWYNRQRNKLKTKKL